MSRIWVQILQKCSEPNTKQRTSSIIKLHIENFVIERHQKVRTAGVTRQDSTLNTLRSKTEVEEFLFNNKAFMFNNKAFCFVFRKCCVRQCRIGAQYGRWSRCTYKKLVLTYLYQLKTTVTSSEMHYFIWSPSMALCLTRLPLLRRGLVPLTGGSLFHPSPVVP